MGCISPTSHPPYGECQPKICAAEPFKGQFWDVPRMSVGNELEGLERVPGSGRGLCQH